MAKEKKITWKTYLHDHSFKTRSRPYPLLCLCRPRYQINRSAPFHKHHVIPRGLHQILSLFPLQRTYCWSHYSELKLLFTVAFALLSPPIPNMTLLYYNMTLTVHDTGVFFAGSFLKLLSDIRTWCQCVKLKCSVWKSWQFSCSLISCPPKKELTLTLGETAVWDGGATKIIATNFQSCCLRNGYIEDRDQICDHSQWLVSSKRLWCIKTAITAIRRSWFVILQWLTVINWYKSNSFPT